MFKRMPLAVAFVVVAALAIASCGSDDKDETTSAANSGNGVDRAFVAEMTDHHELAINMAEIAKARGESPFVRQLADDIVATQTKEIRTMRVIDADLSAAGILIGDLGVPEHLMGMSGDVAELQRAKPFDPTFLAMMIPHHQGAIEMATAEIADGENDDLQAIADMIIEAQSGEIEEMKAHQSGGAETGETETLPGEEHGMGHGG